MITKIRHYFTKAQKQFFVQNGYSVIKGFLTSNQCTSMISRIDQIITQQINHQKSLNVFDDNFKQNLIDSADKVKLFYELKALRNNQFLYDRNKSVNKIGHNLHSLDPLFKEITYSAKATEILKALGYKRPVVPQSMAILKPPRIGGLVDIHQDSTYLITTPDTLLAFWIPLEKSTLQNGCLWGVRGTKQSPLYRVLKQSKYETLEQTPEWKGEDFIPIEMEAGDLIIFNGRFVHKSEENTSQKSRYAYTWHLFDSAVSNWQKYNWIPKRDFPAYY